MRLSVLIYLMGRIMCLRLTILSMYVVTLIIIYFGLSFCWTLDILLSIFVTVEYVCQ